MKIYDYELDNSIDIIEHKANLWILNNKGEYLTVLRHMYQIETGLSNQEVGFHILNQEDQLISNKSWIWISDPYHFRFSKTKFIDGISKYLLERELIDTEKISDIQKQLYQLGQSIAEELDFDITYLDTFSLKFFCQVLKLEVDYDSKDALELIYQIIDVNHILKLYEILIFTSINQYLSNLELERLQAYINQLEETIVLLSYDNESETSCINNINDKNEELIF